MLCRIVLVLDFSSLAGCQCSSELQVHVPPHPLIKHWLAVARSKDNPPAVFRSAIAELGRILIYEAIRDWVKTVDIPVETPLGKADATIIDPASPVKVCLTNNILELFHTDG